MSPDKPIKMPLLRKMALLGLGYKATRKSINVAEQDIFQEQKRFQEFAVRSGGNPDIAKEMAELLVKALRFRKRKAIIKKIASSLMFWPFMLTILLVPVLYATAVSPNYENLKGWSFTGATLVFFTAAILATFLIGTLANFISKLEVKIGRTFRMIIRFLLLLIPHFYLIYTSGNSDTWLWVGSVWICLMVCLVFDIAMLMQLLSDVLPDIYFYSQKIHLTDELILESIYGLSKTRNWSQIMRKRNRRNEKLHEIERLASLIEFDWNSHVVPRDSKNEKWRNTTTRGVANGIRRLKRELIFPGVKSEEVLRTRFQELFVHTLQHNLQGFIQENVPAHRIRKKSPFQVFQQFLIAVLPLVIGLGLCKYFSGIVPQEYQGVLLTVSIGWFIICVLMWLDPNLADKMTMVRRGRSLMNPMSGSED
ncbi:MAG TPA: hypothetical protein VK826_01375 [Bacteroidia bacterium]|nr:hypothetical protein [Bacteroidia bacterium]